MTASAPTETGLKSARCPRCGCSFDCGRACRPFDCWCGMLPALPAEQLDPRGRCLCPACLAEATARAVRTSGGSTGHGHGV